MGCCSAGVCIAAGVLWTVLRPGPTDTDQPASRTLNGAAAYAGPAPGVDTAAAPIPTVTIAPRPTRALRPDAVIRLTAEVRSPAGQVVEGAEVAWSTTDSSVAQVDRSTGRLLALRPGRAQIVAASGAGRDSLVITVRRPGVRAPVAAAVAIDREAIRPVRAGNETQLHAVALGPQGDTLTGAEITWTSSNPQIATVDALTGIATRHTAGTAMILATSGNQSSLAELTVLPNARGGARGARRAADGGAGIARASCRRPRSRRARDDRDSGRVDEQRFGHRWPWTREPGWSWGSRPAAPPSPRRPTRSPPGSG